MGKELILTDSFFKHCITGRGLNYYGKTISDWGSDWAEGRCYPHENKLKPLPLQSSLKKVVTYYPETEAHVFLVMEWAENNI